MADLPEVAQGEGDRAAFHWQQCIADARKYFAFWNERCDAIDRLYADLKRLAKVGGDREYQMFWANLEILKAAVYSRPPVPVVEPRFKEMKQVPRIASELLERVLIVGFEHEDLDGIMLQVRDDLLTNGRGVAWLRYEDDSDPTASNAGGEPADQRVCVDHVDRADFLHEPARKWAEVGWVARRAWLTRDQGLARFGDIFAKVDLKEHKEPSSGGEGADYKGEKKAEIWEIWSKGRNCVVWIAEGLGEVLDIRGPFLQLDGFFPCPRPAFSTLERRRLVPVPDYSFYRDQLDEINELTARISALAECLRMKGFYASGAGDLAEAIETALRRNDDNALLVPVSNFAALGGAALKDSFVWLPVSEVAATIKDLILLRRQLIDDVYQITGLSDIMRGATDPDETLGAQELKSQYGSIRIRERQNELVRFARDLTRIAGEIMAENFTGRTLLEMSQMDLPVDQAVQEEARRLIAAAEQAAAEPQALDQIDAGTAGKLQALTEKVTIEKVVALLREQRIRPFLLDIETQSTIQVDENAEKQRRTEFLASLSGAIQQLTPLVQAQPAAGPFAAEMIKFAVAPFRAGRAMTAVIEEFTETIRKQAEEAASAPPQTDVAMQRLDFEKQKHADEMALRRQEDDRAHEREVRKARLEGDRAGADTGQGPAYSMAEVIEQLARQNAAVLQALQTIAEVMAMPKTVTTPEGRTYTTQTSH